MGKKFDPNQILLGQHSLMLFLVVKIVPFGTPNIVIMFVDSLTIVFNKIFLKEQCLPKTTPFLILRRNFVAD